MLRSNFRRFISTVLLVSALSLQVAASPAVVAQIDGIMTKATKPDQPGVALLVMKDGKPLIRKGYGMADMELGLAISPDMIFRLGSMTKQFTAVAILMLMEQGKLALSDDITKYLPDFPTHGKSITIANLLTHTSGIKNYTDMQQWLPLWRKDMSLKELVAIFKDEPLDFEPDQKWSYSNSGYVLLGAIIEKVSGETYASFIQKHVFEPLGMKHSYYGDTARIIPLRVPGYQKVKDGYENAPYLSMTQPFSAGSLISNVDDLALWDAALYTEKLVKQESLKKAWTSHRLKTGALTGYGFGWAIGEYQNHAMIIHDGGINGFSSSGIRLPDDHIYVVILANDESFDASALAIRVAAISLGKPIQEPVAITLPSAALDQYTGVYQIDEHSQRFITRHDDQLFSQRSGGEKHELTPVSETEFALKDVTTRFRFRKDPSGKVTAMERIEIVNYGVPEVAQKTDQPLPPERQAVTLDPKIYDAYVGDYELAPGFILSIVREGDHLFAQATGQPRLEIFPESETKFFAKDVDAQIEFVKDASGQISLVLHQGGETVPGKRK